MKTAAATISGVRKTEAKRRDIAEPASEASGIIERRMVARSFCMMGKRLVVKDLSG